MDEDSCAWGTLLRSKVCYYINLNLQLSVKMKYLRLSEIPSNWPQLIGFFDWHYFQIACKTISSVCPCREMYKCNTDGSSKVNLEPSLGFSVLGTVGEIFFAATSVLPNILANVQNNRGDFVFANISVMPNTTSIRAEARAIESRMKFCPRKQFLPDIIETESLAITHIVEGGWNISWNINMEVRQIQEWRKGQNFQIEHTLRDGNQVVDYF